VTEDVRALSPWATVDDFAQDLRYGARMLRKHPGFAVIAALTLALGVGATTAIFSIVDAVLLRPLPYADVDRLAMVWENVNLPAYKNAQNTPSPGNFRDWRDRNSTFVDLAAIRGGNWSLTGHGEPIRVEGENVSASLFRLLQVEPLLGRVFTTEEERAGGGHVVLLGHALWADRFASNPAIVGQTIHLNDEPYTVVGVLPRGFHFPDPTDQVYLPLGLTPRASAREREFAVRAALGASRVRLLRQMLAESVLLSAISGVAGLALAYLGVEALRALAPSTLPRIDDIKVNGVVAAFDVAVALAAGILCGLVPAMQARRSDFRDALKDDA